MRGPGTTAWLRGGTPGPGPGGQGDRLREHFRGGSGEERSGVKAPGAPGGRGKGTEENLFLQVSGLNEETESRAVSRLCHLLSRSDRPHNKFSSRGFTLSF